MISLQLDYAAISRLTLERGIGFPMTAAETIAGRLPMRSGKQRRDA